MWMYSWSIHWPEWFQFIKCNLYSLSHMIKHFPPFCQFSSWSFILWYFLHQCQRICLIVKYWIGMLLNSIHPPKQVGKNTKIFWVTIIFISETMTQKQVETRTEKNKTNENQQNLVKL